MPKPSEILANKFPFEPTEGQRALFLLMDKFLTSEEQRTCLVIKGYAGTGKTTVISELVKVLPSFNYKQVLMAPTGRAAKVMSKYSKKVAFTIHNKIYRQRGDPGAGKFDFHLQKNYAKNTIFIVDEASMLQDEGAGGKKGLLTDLMHYVYQSTGNRLLLVGDSAQLPPVGQSNSPGLDTELLETRYNLHLISTELKEVMRQEKESGILANATSLRNSITAGQLEISFNTGPYKDIFKMTGEKMEDGLRYCYDKYGKENTIVVCRSNKQAVQYNHLSDNNYSSGMKKLRLATL